MSLERTLESILFVAGEPLKQGKIAKALKKKEDEVEQALAALEQKYSGESGIILIRTGDIVQLVTHPESQKETELFTKSQLSDELTAAQLETLTVIAYRSPITRPELEQIRGVNCAIILRNLLMRGLIVEERGDDPLESYILSIEALKHLGIAKQSDLPDYGRLSDHQHILAAIEE